MNSTQAKSPVNHEELDAFATKREAERIAYKLIKRSTSHNEIAHAEWSAALADALSDESEGSVKNGDVIEFWGTTESGSRWRVHLAKR